MAPDIDPSVWETLQEYPFEGNVQELKNIVLAPQSFSRGKRYFYTTCRLLC
ncbi:hypothetical protein ACEQPO_16700 [Bacillus sp. SL00103]